MGSPDLRRSGFGWFVVVTLIALAACATSGTGTAGDNSILLSPVAPVPDAGAAIEAATMPTATGPGLNTSSSGGDPTSSSSGGSAGDDASGSSDDSGSVTSACATTCSGCCDTSGSCNPGTS